MPESFSSNFNKERQPERYRYFKTPERRRDIYEFSKGVSNYLYEENIPNIVMIDKSPRALWVGIDEYWKTHFVGTPCPNIYFLNPKGFDFVKKTIEEKNIPENFIALDRLILQATGTSILSREFGNAENVIKEEFEKKYQVLNQDKDKPIAIFDNCIHTGETLSPVLHFLDKQGYADIRIVIGETSNDFSHIHIDKDFTDKVKLQACSAFGIDSGVSDGDGIVSDFDETSDREDVVMCRKEIRRIIQEGNKK